MVRFRIVRYLSALIPFIITIVSPLSQPLYRQFISQYDLRWYTPPEPIDRHQPIALYNGGSAGLPKVMVELDVKADAPGAVMDFDFSAMRIGPSTSFLNTLVDSDALTGLSQPEKDKIATIVDEHSPSRSLYAIDKALDDSLMLKLKTNKAFSSITDELQKTTNSCNAWHGYWLKKCGANQLPGSICSQVDKILENWEWTKRGLYGAAAKRWRELTGVTAMLPSGQISSVGKTFFTLSLSSGESGSLMVDYGPDPVKSVAIKVSSNVIENAFRVDKLSDLRKSPLLIFAKNHILVTSIILLSVFLSILGVWHVIKPNKLRPTYRIFNLALQTNNYEFWEHAYQRHRYFILQRFRHFRDLFNKRNLNLDAEEVLDFVRASLVNRYKLNNQLYKNENTLNRYIRSQVRFLVLYA